MDSIELRTSDCKLEFQSKGSELVMGSLMGMGWKPYVRAVCSLIDSILEETKLTSRLKRQGPNRSIPKIMRRGTSKGERKVHHQDLQRTIPGIR